MSNKHLNNKRYIQRFNQALYDYEGDQVQQIITELFAEDAVIQLAYPLETLSSREALYHEAFQPLHQAIPDLERRCYILMAGEAAATNWVGTAGYYTGTFMQPWLAIPPTGHQVTLRFHEFYRFDADSGKIVEMQALWDIPEVMHQAHAWPMSPSLGREGLSPAPATLDGILLADTNAEHSQQSLTLVGDMLAALGKYAEGGLTAMELEKRWHPRCSWYGPSGIGTCRGISGFRNWHQIPFLNALPDRRSINDDRYLFADGDYVAFTAWPGMAMTVSGDGWLGIAPANQAITLRSLDFWRCENGLIRENWVLVDILHAYKQLGVDVLARMREFNKARYRRFDD